MTKSTERNRVVLAGVAAFCLVAALAGAAFWQHNIHTSDIDSAGSHSTTAALIQQAEAEGKTSSQLLQQYAQTGDQTLLPDIDSHTRAGVAQLTAAVQNAGGDPRGFLDKGTQFVQAAGKVIALRQSGDVQGAAAALQDLSPKFQAFTGEQDAFVDSEQQLAASDTQAAADANDITLWLAVAAGVLAGASVLAAAAFAWQGLGRRRLDSAPSI